MKSFYFLPFVLLTFFSCKSGGRSAQNCKTEVVDSYNRKIEFTQNPQRIVSAAPGITEIIFALGEGHRLVGRTNFCVFPRAVSLIPSIGGLEDPSIETIVNLKPDLVIASTHFKKEVVEQLDVLKVPVVVEKGQDSFEGVYQLINNIALLLNVKAKGDSLVDVLKQRVNKVAEKVKHTSTKPSIYVVIGFGKTGDYTAGGNTFINDMISLAGGKNVASDIQGWSYSLEKLIVNDPNYILIRPGDKKVFCSIESYKRLTAVKNGKVFEVNNDLFELTGPRLVDGLEALFEILHPNNL